MLTARQETVVEVGELWAMPERWVRRQLNTALCVSDGPLRQVWSMCLDGSLVAFRATLVADAVREHLHSPEDVARFAAGIIAFLRRHLRGVEGDDGMGWLSVNATLDQVRLAHQRLTLAARARRAEGDERTLDQLRSDLAIDLIVGRGSDLPVPEYARSVVNVTVPIQTLMGIADHPGRLSGGDVIPAGLARMIASWPGSTWHRMLTDPAGQMVALSTTSYKPTGPIWRTVVAAHTTCFRPGCDRPATESELDHRVAWPAEPTSEENLWPGCAGDHRAKHTSGFGIDDDGQGGYLLRTRAGFRHRIPRSIHPWDSEFTEVDLGDGFQFSATEFVDAVMTSRRAEADRPLDVTGIWEEDPVEGFDVAHQLDRDEDAA